MDIPDFAFHHFGGAVRLQLVVTTTAPIAF